MPPFKVVLNENSQDSASDKKQDEPFPRISKKQKKSSKKSSEKGITTIALHFIHNEGLPELPAPSNDGRIYPINTDSGFCDFDDKTPQTNGTKIDLEIEELQAKAPKTLLESMKSLPFLLNTMWFSVIYMAVNTFIGVYNPWITKVFDGDVNQSKQLKSFIMNILNI